jgi:PAS domain S-box-containing protein
MTQGFLSFFHESAEFHYPAMHMTKQETPLKEQEYAAIGAIARLFLSDTPLEAVCMACASLLAERIEVAAVDISLYDGTAGEIATMGAAGCHGGLLHHPRMPLRQSLYKEVIEGQILITTAEKIDPDCWRRSWVGDLKPAALVFAPMRIQGRAIGALGIADTRAHDDIQQLAGLCQAIADYLAQEVLRKKAEQDLQKKEVFFRTMIDDQTEFVCRLAPDTTFKFVNETYLRYLEKFQEEIAGNKLIDLVDEADKAGFAAQIQALHTGAQAITVEHRWTKPAGDTRWHRWILRMLHDENGLPVEMLGVGRDCTEEKNIQDMLQKNQAMLQAMFDGMADPIFMLDENCIVKMANKATLGYYRVAPEDCINRPCYAAFKAQKEVCEGCDIIVNLNRNEVTTYERTGKSGNGIYEQVTVHPLRLSGIDISSAIIHIKDVTKTRLLEKRVSHSERLASLGLLISGIAHEINNPNNFIAFNIPVLRDYLRAVLPITDEHSSVHPEFAPFGMSYQEFKDDLFKLLDNMEHGSDRINRTVTGLREFIRNQGAKELVWADMHTVVDRAVMLCGSKVKNTVKSFCIAVDDAAAKIYTDPYALEHMLIILIINAAQAADKADSFIRVSVQRGARWQEHTRIEVSDNGCGIAAENRDKLFDPFFTTKASSGGTGLGLYICRDMIKGLGGRIDIDSKQGAGTTVKLVLPDISSA